MTIGKAAPQTTTKKRTGEDIEQTWKTYKSTADPNLRNILIENIHLRNSPMWMQHYLDCDFLTVRGIEVFNHGARERLDARARARDDAEADQREANGRLRGREAPVRLYALG